MIGKLVVHAPDRETAIVRMRAALDECVIRGIHTTVPFHKRVMHDEVFLSGDYDTGFVARLLAETE